MAVEDTELKIHVSLDMDEAAKRLSKLAIVAGTLERRLEGMEARIQVITENLAALETSKPPRARPR